MRRTLTVIEVVLVAATIGFGVASYFLPEENWEPFLVVSGAFLLGPVNTNFDRLCEWKLHPHSIE